MQLQKQRKLSSKWKMSSKRSDLQSKSNRRNGNLHTYTGLTCNTFKERWDKHNFTFTHEDAEHTTLSSFIHELKERGTNYSMKWEIVEKARPFNPISGICALCTREKFLIIFSPQGASLNKRSELFSTCRHKKKIIPSCQKQKNQDRLRPRLSDQLSICKKIPTTKFSHYVTSEDCRLCMKL